MKNGYQHVRQETIEVFRNGEWNTFFKLSIFINGTLSNTDSVNNSFYQDFSNWGRVDKVIINGNEVSPTIKTNNIVEIPNIYGNVEIYISTPEPPTEDDGGENAEGGE